MVNSVPTFQTCAPRTPNGCDAAFGIGKYAVLKNGATAQGGDEIGCLGYVTDGANQACPVGWLFSLYTAPASSKVPILSECWQNNTAAVTSCSSFGSSTAGLGATIAGPLTGCTVPTASCPVPFPYFYAKNDGTLPNPTAGENSCVSTQPSGVPPCGARVPVIDALVGDATTPVVGCLGSSVQLGATQLCPAALPTPTTVTSSFTFWTAPAQNFGGLIAGSISSCYRANASNSCGSSQLGAVVYNSSQLSGCFTNLPNPVTGCPQQAVGGVLYDTELLGPSGPGNSAAVIERCSTLPPLLSCSGVAGPAPGQGGYNVPVTDGNLKGDVPPGLLIACMRANTACPDNSFPLIDTQNLITACCTGRSACAAGAISLCSAAVVPADGVCNSTNTQGCIDAGASRTICGNTTSGYPTADGYPIFVVRLSNSAFQSLDACFSSATSGCSPAGGSPTLFGYQAETALVFKGCTDQSVQQCTNWWSSQPLGGTCRAIL